MIYEILHPIFDALEDEFGFHGLGCDRDYRSIGIVKCQRGNAQNLRLIKQRREKIKKHSNIETIIL